MFKGVISRDDGEPWGATGMSTAKWLLLPASGVPVAELTLTQPGVLFHALIEPTEPVGGDPLPHVVAWGGEMYLEDGHHRVMRAVMSGEKIVQVRVLHI